MKTKKIDLMLIGLLFCVSGTIAQTYYYNTTKLLKAPGYMYQCEKQVDGSILLYNDENQFTHVKWAYKNGSQLSDEIRMGE